MASVAGTPTCRATLMLVLCACACARRAEPAAVAPTPTDHVIPTPEPVEAPIAAPLFTHLLQGLTFIANGHPAAAVPHLRLALIYDPASAFVHERLFIAWAESGDLDHAIEALDDGLARAPAAPGLNLLRGELLRRALRFEDAAPPLEKALADPEQLVEALPAFVDVALWQGQRDVTERAASLSEARSEPLLLLRVGAAFEDHGKLGEALSYYRRGRDQAPTAEDPTFGMVRVLSLLGRHAEAADVLVPMFAFYPDDIGLFVQVTRLYRRAGDALADAYRAEAIHQAAGAPEDLVRIAMADLAEGSRDAGLALLQGVMKTSPDYLDARVLVGELFLGEAEPKKCIEVLGAMRGFAPVHALRSRCLLASGSRDAAVAEAIMAVEAGADARGQLTQSATDMARYLGRKEEARALLGQLCLGLREQVTTRDITLAEAALLDFFGHGEEALRLLTQLLEDEPNDLEIVLRHNDLVARYQDVERSARELSRLLEARPDDPSILNALGFTLADGNLRLSEAEVWLRRAYRQLPEQGFVIDSLGWLLFRLGRFAEARVLLERAEHTTPGDPEILRHLADTYRALSLHKLARATYERALGAGPPAQLEQIIRARLSEAR